MGVIRRMGPHSFCTTAPLLSGECGASTKTKGFGDARIITVLQAITLPINHRGPFLLSSPGRRRGNIRLSLTSGPQCPATKSEGETLSASSSIQSCCCWSDGCQTLFVSMLCFSISLFTVRNLLIRCVLRFNAYGDGLERKHYQKVPYPPHFHSFLILPSSGATSHHQLSKNTSVFIPLFAALC